MRCKGRSPADMARARDAYRAARDDLRLQAESEVATYNQSVEMAANDQADRLMNRPELGGAIQMARTSAVIQAEVDEDLEVIGKVANRSGHLKGTYVKALHGVVTRLGKNFAAMKSLTATEEVVRLEAANAQLSWQLAELSKEVAQLRAQPPAATEHELRKLVEEVSRSNREQFCTMLNARLEGIECRLLPEPCVRPSLAANRRVEERPDSGLPSQQQTEPEGPSGQGYSNAAQPRQAVAGSNPVAGKQNKRRKNKTSLAAKEAAASRHASLPSLPTSIPPTSVGKSNKDALTEVVRRGSKRKGKVPNSAQPLQHAEQAQPKGPKKPKKLRPPRSAAVVLTLLQPQAEEKKATYGSVIAEAKARVKITELGILGLRFRKARTGATILEIAGANCGEKADALARKLETVLDPEVVRISRPTKREEMRISGLDESVRSQDVVEAVAQAGGCSATDIRSGEVVVGPSGLGSMWLSCPVAAAKKVVEAGRLLVGWVSAQVKLLDARPLRCFRCLEVGHVAAKCKAVVDRSQQCYRCGQTGHRASACSAAPECALCKEVGQPASHRMGSKVCNPPKRKTRAADGPRAPSQPDCRDGNAESQDEEVITTVG